LRSLQLAPADRGHALSPEAWIPLCDGGRLHLRRRPTHLCGDPGHCAGGLSIREFFVRPGAVRSRERAAFFVGGSAVSAVQHLTATARQRPQQTLRPPINDAMSDGQKFRERARDCRTLAKSARNPQDAALLAEIADELDAEADKIDGREGRSATEAT